MSFSNKVKRAIYNPYVAIRRNPLTTAVYAGILASATLYIGGLMFFATPEILAAFITVGVYTTAVLTVLTAASLAIGLAALAAALLGRDIPFLEISFATSVIGLSSFGIYEMFDPLMAALAATNPLTPLIILGVVATAVSTYISLILTFLVIQAFEIKAEEYHYIEDDELLLNNDYDNDLDNKHKNSNDKINDLLPPLDANHQKNEPEVEPIPVPQYHDGVNIIPEHEIAPENLYGHKVNEQDVFVPKVNNF